MKVSIEKAAFAAAVGTVARVVPSRTTMDVLTGIHMKTDGNGLTLSATDTFLGVRCRAETGFILEEGECLIDAKRLSGLVPKLPEDVVLMETVGGAMKLSCGKFRMQLPLKDAGSFPAVSAVEEEPLLIPAPKLKEAIDKVIFSVGQEEKNRMMAAVNFAAEGKVVTLTALDGFRIAIRTFGIDSGKAINLNVPGTSLKEVSRLCGRKTEDVRVSSNGKLVSFELDGTLITARLVEGVYFNTRAILSGAAKKTEVRAEKKALLEALDRAMLLSDGTARKPVRMVFGNKVVKIQMSTGLEEILEEVEISKTGPDVLIGMNPHFMVEALKAIDDEEVVLQLSTGKSPLLLGGEGFTYFMLPVNIASKAKVGEAA